MPAANNHFALRTAFFYGALFFATGVYLPFFPVWLSGQGLSEPQIGLIIAAPFFIRALFSPTLALLADRFADLNIAAGLYGVVAGIVFAGLALVSGFWPILILSALAMVFWSALVPIGDAIAIVGVRRHQIDYGRVRMWGSVTFIAANFATAEILRWASEDGVFRLQTMAFVVGGLVAFWLPRVKLDKASQAPARLRELLADPLLRRAVLAGSLILGSHAAYYAFGSIYWRELGFPARTIASLWAYSVVIEVGLFWAAKRLTGWGARRYLLAAGMGGLVRWILFPLATVPPAAFVLQTLHSLTFAAAYLGVIMSIGATSAPGHTARLQAGFQLVSGVVIAIATVAAGPLFRHNPMSAFWMAAFMAAAGLFFAYGLRRGIQPPAGG